MDLENLPEGNKPFPYLSSSFESWNPQIKIPSLKSISATFIASKIWGNPILKHQLKDLFSSHQDLSRKQKDCTMLLSLKKKSYGTFFKAIRSSSEEILNKLELSVNLINYCRDVVNKMGDEILDWMEYVFKILKFDIKFCERIYWTPNGAIDENKIFQSWANDEEFAKQKNSKAPAAYLLACINVQLDFIDEHQSEMEQFIRKDEPKFQLSNYPDKVNTLMASYLHCLVRNMFIPMESPYMFQCIASPIYMMEICAKAGLIKAAFYFWECYITNKNDFGVTLKDLGEAYLSNLEIFTKSSYRLRNEIKFLLFLISKMTDAEKNEFLTYGVRYIVRKILCYNPLHVIILELVENYTSQLLPNDWESIISTVLSALRDNKAFNLNNSKIFEFRQLFEKILMKVPDDIKKEFFNFNVMSRLFDADLKCFKLVISNMDENTRSDVIESIRPQILMLAKDREIEQLNELMNDILISGNERTSCKDYILSRKSEILKGTTIEFVVKLFDCLSLSKEERATFRFKIDEESETPCIPSILHQPPTSCIPSSPWRFSRGYWEAQAGIWNYEEFKSVPQHMVHVSGL